MTALLWLYAFAWTLALELPVYVVVLRRSFTAWWPPCALALAVNLVTHPLLWFAFPQLSPWPLHLVVSEACVIAVEAAIVAVFVPWRRAVVAAVLANVISTLIGLVLIEIV
ncbi:MAG TPA: hypothetical protein VFQ53_03730 [Kofleriaceae bacterium]|nr:hypothetical protein [Kofleriaceae bacterium]